MPQGNTTPKVDTCRECGTPLAPLTHKLRHGAIFSGRHLHTGRLCRDCLAALAAKHPPTTGYLTK